MTGKDSASHHETPKFLVEPKTNTYQERYKDSNGRWQTSTSKKSEIEIWGNQIEFVKFRQYGEENGLLTPYGVEQMNTHLAKALDIAPIHVRKAFDNYPKELMAHYIVACPDDHPADKILEFATRNTRHFSLAAGIAGAPAAITSMWYAFSNAAVQHGAHSDPGFGYFCLGIAMAIASIAGFVTFSEAHDKVAEAENPASNDVVEFRDQLRQFIVDKNHALGIEEILPYETYEAPAQTVAELTPDQRAYLEAYSEQMKMLGKAPLTANPTPAELARLNATLDFQRAHHQTETEERHETRAALHAAEALPVPPPEKREPPMWPHQS